ncbi:MAG: GFA family protein [Alphaproteobacteria bacterium]|nr:GFA family protein [Alphaproteobacteria bacterium]
MPAPYDGGCQCGRIRYTLDAEPVTLYVCHCTECQKQSSSALGMSMTVARETLRVTQGTPKTFTRAAASGHDVLCTYCGDCGTRLFHETSRRPQHVNLKPGTLDDTHWLVPVAHVWTKNAQPWVTIPDDVLVYAGQPPSLDPLIAAYRRLSGA